LTTNSVPESHAHTHATALLEIDWIRLSSVDSTNSEARRLFDADKIHHLTCVTATTQTAGRGTQSRTWASPPGGLYFSLVYPGTGYPLSIETPYTRLAGKACQQALKTLYHLDVSIKGVNDLFVNNRKLGGILTESVISNGTVQLLIVGIGLNMVPLTDTLADERNTPISLQEAVSTPFTAESTAYTHLMKEIAHRLTVLITPKN